MTDDRCPCGRGMAYDECCGPIHRGEKDAATAELLMRSRYSAFALGDEAYLRRSWHPSTCPRHIRVARPGRWVRLDVLGTTGGGLLDAEGTVEFMAHHEDDAGAPAVLHEHSRFVREGGRWSYLGPA